MEWLKKNGTLALGVGLPLLLVVFFSMASVIPAMLVPAPRYDALYLVHYSFSNANGMHYQVRDGHVSFSYTGMKNGDWPKLYRYSPATGNVKEIPIATPDNLPDKDSSEKNSSVPVPVPETEALRIDASTLSPDGYSFQSDGWRNGRGLVGIFFSPSPRGGAALVKDGRVVAIPMTGDGDGYSYFGNVKFIGWVL